MKKSKEAPLTPSSTAMDNNLAIIFENVSKRYELGLVTRTTLKRDVQRFWEMKILGREDPCAKISSNGEIRSGYVWALKNISLDIKAGDAVGIIGRNGAGKSTLLKILSRVTGPTSGNIYIHGRLASMLEVGTGFNMELTGRENIYLSGAIQGLSKSDIDSRIDDIIEFSGCETYIDTPVKRYSSGMYVRLGFAVAAFIEPDILVVDEVLAVGDAQFQAKAIGRMKDISREGSRTVLFVSHNMGSIKSLCNKCIWMEDGFVKEYGPTEKVVDDYLRSCLPESSSPVWVSNDSLKKNFRVVSVKVVDCHGDARQVFTCDEGFNILVEVEMSLVKSCIVGRLDFIRSDDGTIVWCSQSNDLEQGFSLQEGSSIVSISVPARTLAAGEYVVSLLFTEKGLHKPWTIAKCNNILNISIHDYTTPLADTRQGHLSTLLEWKVTR